MAETPTDPNQPASWADKLDADHQQFIQGRGWDKLDAGAAAAELAKAYRGSERLRGGLAAGDVVALPKEGDAASARAFWERVGAPKGTDGYAVDVKRHDGRALDEGYLDAARKAAMSANMPAQMLQQFMAGMQPYHDGEETGRVAREQVDLQAAQRSLHTKWGPDAPRNQFMIARVMDTLNTPPEAVSALQKAWGHEAAMDHFLQLANMMGEGRWVTNETGGRGTLTPQAAQDELDRLMADADWRTRFLRNGIDGPEGQRRTELVRIIHNVR
jgi:hypothetical protein